MTHKDKVLFVWHLFYEDHTTKAFTISCCPHHALEILVDNFPAPENFELIGAQPIPNGEADVHLCGVVPGDRASPIPC